MNKYYLLLALILFAATSCTMNETQLAFGDFEGSSDIGDVRHNGETKYNPKSELYTLKGSGTNMWYEEDEFHMVWKRISGDLILYSQINLIGEGVDPHRKGGLIFRESMDPGSPYVSAAYHGDGLVSMQYRLEKDSATNEMKAEDDSLSVLQLFIMGDSVTMHAGTPETPLLEVGNLSLNFLSDKEYYVGLFVCSHNPDVVEEVQFFNTRLTVPAKEDFIPYTDYIGSRLEILDIYTGRRRIIFESELPIEAPNWSRDGEYFVVNAGGLLYKIPVEGGEADTINTGFARSNNNDHGISPDGLSLVISNHTRDRPSGKNSVIYTLPIEGGEPVQVTENSPSYWHGWSQDGKYLIYTANRNDQWDIYRIPVEGGEELQLTNNPGLDDGSEYSADGQYIWFNSNRSGSMEIWRMRADGSEQVQITNDEYQNWFAHESPDGKHVIFLSYPPEVNLWDHPYYKHVMLRIMDTKEMIPRVIAHLYGGQGTINVHSWSPDGSKVAFVSNTEFQVDDME